MYENLNVSDNFLDETSDLFVEDSSFYSTPKTTELWVSFKKDKNSAENKFIIGNAVVANLEESNEKIPVYAYNSDIYVKYLKGKKIITGNIILRKTSISSFFSLTKEGEVAKLKAEVEEKAKSDEAKLEEIYEKAPTVELRNLVKKYQLNIQKQKESEIERIDTFGIAKEAPDNLLYFSDYNKNGKVEFEIVFKNQLLEDTSLKIKDVLFLRKSTDINISKTDIMEVYQFIGNPVGKIIDKN